MKKVIIITVAGLVVFIVATIPLWPLFTTHKLTIESEHVESVSIEYDQETNDYTNLSDIRITNDSPAVLSYIVNDEDYENGSLSITGAEGSITIQPEYSSNKRKEVSKQAYSSITKILNSQYVNLSLYTIQPGDVFQQGAWYTTSLVYKGSYGFDTDTLRVIAKNDDRGWVLITEPEILLTTAGYPDIPLEVLQWANKYSN